MPVDVVARVGPVVAAEPGGVQERVDDGSVVHPVGSGEERPMPARTAVVFGDDATGGADVQTGQLSRASGRTAG